MATFLLKTEPGDYSFDDLVRDRRTAWSGVRSNAAQLAIRAARKGDEALIYHTGDERAIVGLGVIASDPYPDPGAGEARLAAFDLAPKKRAKSSVTLAQIKGDARFAGFALVRQPRLSVMPVPPQVDRLLRELAGL